MNTNVDNFLDEYYNNPDPQYAVLLKGKWGCGKTHFIKKWFGNLKEQENLGDSMSLTIKPIYVSLYGLKRISEVKTAIDRELHPLFYSKGAQFLKSLTKVAGKVVLKTDFNINGNGEDDLSCSLDLDLFSAFRNSDVVKGVKFIVFDDFERSHIPMKELLGFVNYFVEHCGCHVVVVGDESMLIQNDKNALDEFKEKTIGREFEILPDIDDAVCCFLAGPEFSSLLQSKKSLIIRCFHLTKTHNLRILRQSLFDFQRQVESVGSSIIEGDQAFLDGLLCSFIATYAEYGSKENHDLIMDWNIKKQLSYLGSDTKEGERIRMLGSRYHIRYGDMVYDALRGDCVELIVKHITTGASMASYIEAQIEHRKRKDTPLEKLARAWEMSNDEFDLVYSEVKDKLLGREMTFDQMGLAFAYLSYYDASCIQKLEEAYLLQLENSLKARIDAENSLESLCGIAADLKRGYRHFDSDGKDMSAMKRIFAFVDEEVRRKGAELPNRMQSALENLSEDNVNDLYKIDEMVCPVRGRTFHSYPVFDGIDADAIFESIKGLSNRGRQTFALFLARHYDLDYQSSLDESFESEIPVLLRMKELTEAQRDRSVKMDRYSYDVLLRDIEKSIRRCEGSGAVK